MVALTTKTDHQHRLNVLTQRIPPRNVALTNKVLLEQNFPYDPMTFLVSAEQPEYVSAYMMHSLTRLMTDELMQAIDTSYELLTHQPWPKGLFSYIHIQIPPKKLH